MKRPVSDFLDAHREEIDALLEQGASQARVAAALNVKTTTFRGWLSDRDRGGQQSDDEVQDALRRLAESVSA